MLHNTLHIQSNNYNASTNTPALTTTTGYNDNIFQVTTQGIQTINGVSSFCGVGDQIIVSNAVSQFYVVLPVQYNAATGAVGALAVTITQLQQVGRIITISVAGTQTINGVSVAMVVGQAWEYNGSSWLNITNPFATQAQVNAGVVNNLPLAPSTFAASSQLAALAPLASPAFTGIPTAPTAALGTNTTQVASTAFVLANANTSDSYATQAQVNAGVVSNLAIAPSTFAASSQLAALAPLASPAFTGIPTAPTAALGTNTTQVASTAFVLANANTSDSYATQAQVNAGVVSNLAIAPSTFAASTQLAAKAPLVSPALTGTPTAPTAALGDNTTQLATTAFVKNQGFQPNLGFTPVQQGGGTGQQANKLYMGWGTNSRIKVQVDTTDQGNLVTDSYLNNGTLPASFTTLAASGTLNVLNGSFISSAAGEFRINTLDFSANLAAFTASGVYFQNGATYANNQTKSASYQSISGDRPVVNYTTDTRPGNGIALLQDVIGVGQTWQNVTGSRAVGVTYPNTTSKPIEVSIVLHATSGPFISGYVLYVQDLQIAAIWLTTGDNYATLTAIVPSGNTYKVSGTGGGIYSWYELR